MTKRPHEAGFSILSLALLAGLAGTSVAQGVQTQAAAPERASQLIDPASKTHGIAADRLSIGSRAIQKHPLTGVTVELAKVVDAKTGEAYLVALDAAGRPIDAAKATEAEAAARAAKYGKLDQKLAERLAGMGFGEYPAGFHLGEARHNTAGPPESVGGVGGGGGCVRASPCCRTQAGHRWGTPVGR